MSASARSPIKLTPAEHKSRAVTAVYGSAPANEASAMPGPIFSERLPTNVQPDSAAKIKFDDVRTTEQPRKQPSGDSPASSEQKAPSSLDELARVSQV